MQRIEAKPGAALGTRDRDAPPATDFKLDLTPVDGRRTDLARMGSLAKNPGIRLLLSDSTNAEKAGHSPSETSVAPVFARLFHEHAGRRIITASFASRLHRIQQLADAAIASGRKVASLGLSIRRNVASGIELGVLHIPPSSMIDIDDIDNYRPARFASSPPAPQANPCRRCHDWRDRDTSAVPTLWHQSRFSTRWAAWSAAIASHQRDAAVPLILPQSFPIALRHRSRSG